MALLHAEDFLGVIASSSVMDGLLRGDKKCEFELKCLLQGATPATAPSQEVEAANANSRSKIFAAREDKHEPTIIRNASVPTYVEAALQRERGSHLTSTGARCRDPLTAPLAPCPPPLHGCGC